MDFTIENLGRRTITSPIKLSNVLGDMISNYTADDERVLLDSRLKNYVEDSKKENTPLSIEIAGPREHIYFDSKKVHAAIVTCGGLCPGINDVIRSLVMELWYWYGVRRITGIRYGYAGLVPERGFNTLELKPDMVDEIHYSGGSFLGSSRGNAKTEEIVDSLERMNINILFTIGGDGTQRGALAIHDEASKRGLKISVIGIPKTIDNDILYVDKSFGFETAFSLAVGAIKSAHVEAKGAYNGIGIVKLMGRDSGFIAASATLANHDVNFVLVPEVPFDMEGPNGFLKHLENRLNARHHAVICVAEGAGQDIISKQSTTESKKDASGNILHSDIGVFLCDRIKEYFKSQKMDSTIKYIDPSYMIRSAPAIPSDAVYCGSLGQNAVHAAMAGKTGMIVGRWKKEFTHLPIRTIISGRKKIDPDDLTWLHVIAATGQPFSMINK